MKRFMFVGMILSLFLLSVPSSYSAVLDGASKDVMIQGFHWESHQSGAWWTTVQSKAGDLAASGITIVWFPPSSAAASDEGYLPNRLLVQTSKYGTEAQLKSAIGALHTVGIKAVADIVINHRCGTANWADFTDPVWGADSVCKGDEWAGATGAYDTGEGYAAARDIDHTKAYIQTSIKDWMNWLKTYIGYDGWRYDFVRGYSGYYNQMYNNATAPYISVGEYWADLDINNPNPSRQALCNWISSTGGTCGAFDFTTKGVLGQACANNEFWRLKDSEGKPSGLIGWWPAKAITFIDNHDTGPSTPGGQNLWPFPSDKVMWGYAYILTHPGIPCVYWVHFYDWGLHDAIKALISIRKNNGINSTSVVSIAAADSSKYAAIIDNKVAVKIGNGDWNPGAGWTIAATGTGYAVWTKSSTPPPTTGLRTVVFMFKETTPGQDIFIKGGHDAALVPSVYPAMAEPITYLNTKNATTAPIKANDVSLDWGTESALDWTCNVWPAAWGTKKTYAVDGFGEDPENTMGLHWWKFDVKMQGTKGDWFEFKAFMREGSTTWWESDRAQARTPYKTINHWGKKGYITKCKYNDNSVEFIALP